MANSSINKTNASALSGGKVWFISAIIVAVLAAGGVFVIINSVASTTTYYVLNRHVDARTLITSSMLTPVATSVGGEPRNALTLGDVNSTPTYSKYELNAGDVLSTSNVGAATPITAGVPEDFVVASFQSPAENSVAGRIKRGDYIDVIAVANNETGDTAKYVLKRVLVLDATASLSNATTTTTTTATDPNASAADTETARQGVPTLYTVALPKKDAVTLALVSNDKIFVVLSSVQDVTDGATPESIMENKVDVYLDSPVGDSGVGTDNTFGKDKKVTENPSTTTTPTPSATPSPSATTNQ